MSGIVTSLEIVAGQTPASGASMNVPPTSNRVRGDNYTNQWVRITGPVDRFIQPFQTGISWSFTLPFSQNIDLVAKFEAPPGWNQAAAIATQKCVLIVSEDANATALDSGGFPAVSTNVYVEHFEDNADPTHPYMARFYIPRSIVNALGITLSYLALPYRYYVSASALSSATETTSGGATVTSTATAPGSTDAIGPGNTDNASPSSGGPSSTSFAHVITSTTNSTHDHPNPPGPNPGFDNAPGKMDGFTFVSQGLATDTHGHTVTHQHTHATTHVHAHSATHTHNTTITAHSHAITVTTSVTMLPGITEELTTPSWGLVVDGNPIASPPLNALDLDILPSIMKDASGIPTIGWHTISWSPASRTRLQADIVVQLSVSAGGLSMGNNAAFQSGAFQAGAFVGA